MSDELHPNIEQRDPRPHVPNVTTASGPISFAAPSSDGRRAFSQEELITEARQWIKTHYPDSDPDTRMARLGLLLDFVTDIVPNEQDQRRGHAAADSQPTEQP